MLRFGVDFEGTELALSLEAAQDSKAFSNSSAEAMAMGYKWFVRSNYISGQVLKVVTGELLKQYKYKKIKTGNFQVYPGSLNYISSFQTGEVITPNRGSVLRWFVDGIPFFRTSVVLPKRPFVDKSFNAYVGSGKALARASAVVKSMLRDRGF